MLPSTKTHIYFINSNTDSLLKNIVSFSSVCLKLLLNTFFKCLEALEEKLTQPQQKKRRAAEMKTKSVAVARDSELAACGEKRKISNPMSSAICTAEASDPTEPKGSELTVANLDSTMPPICGASYPAEEVINGEASTSFDPLASDPVNHCETTVTVLTFDDFAGSEVGSRSYTIHSDGREDQEIEIRGVPIA